MVLFRLEMRFWIWVMIERGLECCWRRIERELDKVSGKSERGEMNLMEQLTE